MNHLGKLAILRERATIAMFRTGMRSYAYLCSQCKQCRSRNSCLEKACSTHLQSQRKILCRTASSSWNGELRAFSSLLTRSGFNNANDLARLLNIGSVRHFSRTSGCQQQEDGEKKGPNSDRFMFLSMLAMAAVYVTFLVLSYQDDTNSTQGNRFPNMNISWNEFYHEFLAKGEVEKVEILPDESAVVIHLYRGAVIQGEKTPMSRRIMKIASPPQFEKKLRKAEEELGIKPGNGVSVTYRRFSGPSSSAVSLVTYALMTYLLYRLVGRGKGMNPMDIFSNIRKAKYTRVEAHTGMGISFKDVAGLKEAKVEVMEFVDYMKSPQRFQQLGAKIPRGALLLGPPGCGKTLLAKAVASEAEVPFLALAGTDFVEMIGGLGASRVRDLFKEARKLAPCIVFIDEIDAAGKKRGSSSQGSQEEEQTLQQLLVEMDGMGTMGGVIVLASTNRADMLDKALLRPGRFDRHIMIDLPTMIERKETFDMYLGKLKLAQDASVYSTRLAQLTPGMSGADIANVCNEAAIHAARDKKPYIDGEDFEYAVERMVAGAAKKTRLLSPDTKKIVAYHESGHALVGWMLKHTDALLRISIIPRTNSALGFTQYMPSDQKLYSTEELFERMCMALGGRAAEAIIFNHITTGAQDDLQKVTKMAFKQIESYGMNEKVGYMSFPEESSDLLGTKPYSKRLAAVIDEEARSLVRRAYQHTEMILQQNRDKLEKLATTLLTTEVLNYNDIEKLIGPPPFGKKNTIEPHGWEGIMPENDSDKEKAKPNQERKDMS